MGFSLKKLLEGAAAQINMNDGGKTFATVVRNQPVQSQPAKTPPPSYGSNPVKQAINRTRDVFDANTPQDRFKRQQVTGMPNISYRQQQINKGIPSTSIANNPLQRAGVVASSIAKPIARSANTLAGASAKLTEGMAGLGAIGAISAFGTDQQYQKALDEGAIVTGKQIGRAHV